MDEGSLNTGGTNWAEWFQGVVGGVVGKAADAEYVRPYDVAAMRLQALGSNGYYREGVPGTMARPAGSAITPGVLLLGGAAIVAFMMLRD